MTINDLIGKKVLACKIYFGSERYFDSMEIVEVNNDNVAIIGIESSWLGDIDITNGDKELVESFAKDGGSYWQKLEKFEWNSTPNKEISLYNKKEILDILKQKKQVVKYDNKYWVDSDNNKWSCQLYSQEEAEYFSKTSADCKDCTNCVNCSSCVDCDNCSDCIKCLYCTNCTDSTDCISCDSCKNCENYENCVKCNNGTDSTDCISCDNCENCNHCNKCIQCEKCNNCTKCINCRSCDFCDNCTFYYKGCKDKNYKGASGK